MPSTFNCTTTKLKFSSERLLYKKQNLITTINDPKLVYKFKNEFLYADTSAKINIEAIGKSYAYQCTTVINILQGLLGNFIRKLFYDLIDR